MKRHSILSLLIISSLLFSEQNVFAAKAKGKTKEKAPVEKNSFELYPEDFSALLKDALNYCSLENFEEAVACFDERIYGYRKEEASEKITVRLELISADIQKQIREYKKLRMEKAAKKMDFSNGENISSAEDYFSRLASISNKLRDLGQQIQSAGSSGYPYYLSRFILGISEEPDSGLAGTIEVEFTKELSQLMDSVREKTNESCRIIDIALQEKNIFTNSETLSKAEPEFEKIIHSTEELSKIYGLNSKLKGRHSKTQRENADFSASMKAVNTLCREGLKFFSVLASLQNELKKEHKVPENKILSIRSENDEYANNLVLSASNLTAWGKTAASSAKSHALSTLSSIQDEKLSWSKLAVPYRQASFKTEAKCTQSAVAMWVSIANYYADTGVLLFQEDSADCEKLKGYMQGTDGVYYPSRCVKDLELLKDNIRKDKVAIARCKTNSSIGYMCRSHFLRQKEIISAHTAKVSALEKDFNTIEADAEGKLLKARLAKNEIEIYCDRARVFNEENNFQQSFSNFQSANSAYIRLTEDLMNDGDIQGEVFSKLSELRNSIIARQQPVFNREIRAFKNEARTSYYAGEFEKAIGFLSQADSKRDMWAKLLDVTLDPDTELERLKNFVNTAIAIKEGSEIQPYDAKAPEMRQNLSIAGKYYEKGSELLKQGKRKEAEPYFNRATEKINQVKIYYPRNKIASVLSLKITKILDEKNFDEIFRVKVDELKQVNYASRNSLAQESYSSLLDLHEMNPNYPGLAAIIENAEYSMGLKQRPADKTGIAKAASLAKEAQELLGKAGRDTLLLQQAKEKAQAAIDLNPDNSIAITVLDEIALRTGQQAAVVLSAKDEAIYQSALADLQKNNIFDANAKLAQLMKNSVYARSAKIIKLKKRIEAQL